MKKVLIVTPHWPPLNAPDMQRARMSLPYYRENGWEAVVLAVADRFQDGVREPELLDTIPPDARVVRAGAVPLRWSRLLGVGTIGLRAFPFLWFKGSEILRKERFDLVFFSNTHFITFVLGPVWKRRFGVPYVIDVQDPWRTDYYERAGSRRPPGGWKYQFARLLAWAFEGPCFRGASAIMSVSPSYIDELRARYRGMATTPSVVLRFGANPIDLTEARKISHSSYSFDRSKPFIHFLYTGASGPVMPHALSVLFVAYRIYRELHPDEAARFRFHFIGTSYVAPGKGKMSVLPVAEEFGVGDRVSEIPHRIGHLEAIRLQQEADVLLLPGSSDLAYSPSKIYYYYLTKKPMLGLVFRNSVMEHLLEELSCAHLARFSENQPKDAAYAETHRFFELALAGFPAGAMPPRNDEYFNSRFLAPVLTRKQCELFELALVPRGSRHD